MTSSPHLQFLAVLVVHRHGHLHVLGRRLVAFIEISLDQSHVDVIPHVTCRGRPRGKNIVSWQSHHVVSLLQKARKHFLVGIAV